MLTIPTTAWAVAIPVIPDESFGFTFTSVLPVGPFGFKFRWFNDVWNVWVTLPSGEIRQAGGYPNSFSWTGFADYYFQFSTFLDSIGQNDLDQVTMVVYQV